MAGTGTLAGLSALALPLPKGITSGTQHAHAHRSRGDDKPLANFTLFPRLPAELRLLIWEFAIEDPIRVMLFPRGNSVVDDATLPRIWAPDDWLFSFSERHRTRRSLLGACVESRRAALARLVPPHLPINSRATVDRAGRSGRNLQPPPPRSRAQFVSSSPPATGASATVAAAAAAAAAAFKRPRVPVDWGRDVLHVAALRFEPEHRWMAENDMIVPLHKVQRLAIELREFKNVLAGSLEAQGRRVNQWAESLIARLPALRRLTLIYSYDNDIPLSLPRKWDEVGLRNEFPNICPWRHGVRPCLRASENVECHVDECEVVHRIRDCVRKWAGNVEVHATVCFLRGFDWEVRAQYRQGLRREIEARAAA